MNTRLPHGLLTTLRLIVILIFVMGTAGASHPGLRQPGRIDRPASPMLSETDSWVDADHDLLDDNYENTLMRRFAPLVILKGCDDEYPASINWYLTKTKMGWGSTEVLDPVGTANDPAGAIDRLIGQSHPTEVVGETVYSGANGSGT